ncbi:MAG: phosphotransferase [Lachnospiraceae bacterium]|nr:phosphotransferase [Lachnospiraceae bacterium]
MAGIPGFCFIKAENITKGLSGDKKYYLETEKGDCFLARITESKKYKQKKALYKLLQKISKNDIPMPMPVNFGYCKNKNEIYTLLSWVDGKDAEKVLPGLSRGEQYCLGVRAGRILRKLHNNNEIKCSEDWQTRYFSVIGPRLLAFKNENISFDGSVQILEYLETNKRFLANRPQTFHHGDFHLGNMVIGNKWQLSVIDWDTADFENIGDPWYEFNRTSIQVPAFATGQIDGYFENSIPDVFWKLFTFYIAGSAITSIVWAKYSAPECMAGIMKLNMDIVRWHDGMKNPVPIWYDKSLKYYNA